MIRILIGLLMIDMVFTAMLILVTGLGLIAIPDWVLIFFILSVTGLLFACFAAIEPDSEQ